jgi:hypothetical protein
MLSFLSRFAGVVRGVLNGFDRLFFRGCLRRVCYVAGMCDYLRANRLLYKDFARHSQQVSKRLIEASLQAARRRGREIRYLNSGRHSKEDIARAIAARDRIRHGLVCVLSSLDPCTTFTVRGNPQTRRLEVRARRSKCLHLYHYQIHPVFGFMHARIQTWFPFHVHVCLNGREWLARQMDQARLGYVRRDNTFTWLEDVAQAQALFDQQLQAAWPSLLGELAQALNPVHAELFACYPCSYYWSAVQSEWASDVMFQSRAALEAVYAPLVRYGISHFRSADILRFLGQPVAASGRVPHANRRDIHSNVKERVEGVRLKHWHHGNSLKLYDKGSVLRAECLIQNPKDFKVYRTKEGDPDGDPGWRPLRRGVADLARRAEVSQAANGRYLEALAAVQLTTPLRQLAEPLCRPVPEPARRRPRAAAAAAPPPAAPPAPLQPQGAAPTTPPPSPPPEPRPRCAARPRRVRALNPLAATDAALLEAVSRPEFLLNGLRNRDLRPLLYGDKPVTADQRRRQAAAVTRKLRLLRAHGLLHKVPKTHRYVVSPGGREAITALLAARNASVDQLTRAG